MSCINLKINQVATAVIAAVSSSIVCLKAEIR